MRPERRKALRALASRAAVPDAATERWRGDYFIQKRAADKAETERDAALAAVSDARAVCLQLGGVDGDVSPPAPSYYVSVGRNVVATEVLAALDGAPEPEVKP